MRLSLRPVFVAVAILAMVGCSSGQGAKPNTGAAGVGGGGGAGGSGNTAGGAGGASGASGAGGMSGATGGTTGGSAPVGGGGGASGGTTGMGGGAGTQQTCTFQIDGAPSAAISTVGVVNWSTDLAGLSSARIEFTLNDPSPDEINRGSGGPIDVTGTQHRALMLGLKPARAYTYRIVASAGANVCTSPDRTLATGTDAGAPKMTITRTRNALVAAAPAPGFVVTTNYGGSAYIFDADGAIVWWAAAPSSCSRARMDWEGANMWMLFVNGNQSTNGKVRRISMDGTDVLDVAGMNNAHHDLTVLPGGIVATLLWSGESSAASDLVERSPDGTIKTVVRIADNVFGRRAAYHTNAISYRAADDTYVVGDLEAAGYAKLARDGKLLWELGGACPTGAKCASADAVGAHGHHLLDGRILIFKARLMPSLVHEYTLTETAGALTATRSWSYDPGGDLWTAALGDVQRLPNGNTLITWSLSGQMRELSPTGDLIQTIQPYSLSGTRQQLGYADFRPTLYGPPPR